MTKLEAAFWRYSKQVSIPSKDSGITKFVPLTSQTRLITEVLKGIVDGKHEQFICKPRQVGATTALAILDAFWLQAHKGVQGLFAADSDSNATFFRSVMTELIKSAPRIYRHPIITNNRTQILWGGACQSRLLFQVANARTLGRGRGLNMLHATECAYWKDLASIGSLRAALSENNPDAYYVYESTSNGFNSWYDLWKDAERATTVNAIFIAWWMNSLYALDPESNAYKVYWDNVLTADERAVQRDVERRYGHVIEPVQWAWYRWKLAERVGNEILMKTDFPSLPEESFQASGQPFIGYAAQQKLREEVDKSDVLEAYSYNFGGFIEQTEVYQTDPQIGQLMLWEKPDKHAHYVIAADPAYGASENSDQSVCQVWRATKNKLYQVAEFSSNQISMTQFAWVCAHLCGAFMPNAYFILELNGPGMAVHQEIERLKAWGWGTTRRAEFQDALQAIQNYLWARPDSRLGIGNSYQWRTTPQTKVWILNRLRDQLMNGKVTARSRSLVDEIGNIRQTGDKFSTEGSGNDDRAIACALALEMWAAQVAPALESMPDSPEEREANARHTVPEPAHQRTVQKFFDSIGIRDKQ